MESNGMYVKGVGLLKVEGLRFSLSKRKLLTVEYFPQQQDIPTTLPQRHKSGQVHQNYITVFKGALSGMRQFLATESPLKMMKNAFYFTLKALF